MPGHTRRHSAEKTAEPIEMPFEQLSRVDTRNHVFNGVQIPHANGQFLGERTCSGMPDNTLPSTVQKWLNRSRCRLFSGLGWVE